MEMEYVHNVYNDIQVLHTIWFSKITSDTHKECLDYFNGPQAYACKLFFYMLPQLSWEIYTFFFILGGWGLGFWITTFAFVQIYTYVVQKKNCIF